MLSFWNSHDAASQGMSYNLLLKALYSNDFPVISVGDAHNSGYVFLDIRERKEYQVSYIKNAQYVGYDDFDLKNIANISKDTPIVIYCSIGVRSQEIGEKLQRAGYTKVFNLYGGIFQWINEDLPVYNKKGRTNQIHAYSRMWGIWLNKGEKVYE